MRRPEITLPVPTEVFDLPGTPAETYPPLRDRPDDESRWEITDVADVDVEEIDLRSSAERERGLLETATAHAAVQRELGGAYVAIGLRLQPIKARGDAIFALFYSYEHQLTVEARLDDEGQVTGVTTSRIQPAFTSDEIAQAVEIARAALGERANGYEAGVIEFTPDYQDERAARRLADVRFFDPSERLPHYGVVVDIADREAVRSHRIPRGKERNRG